MQRFNVAGNYLTGSLPESMVKMRDVKGFFIYGNFLSGMIPTEIGDLNSISKWRILSRKYNI